MPIDWSQFHFAKGTPRVIAKHERKVTAKASERDAYADVDKRDKGKSRISGRPTTPGAIMPEMRREHHHIKLRSTHPELAHEPSNILTITAQEHALIHAGALELEGTDANGRIVAHWNYQIIKRGAEPFKLLSKRRSQNKETAA